ncbi:MCE family protein [Aeromicrobium sp. A1-2]|uniref:MCE family protein n=1 Tax=Aeromicrobium sp. A1-2 TaxID=2107713 RepID=UPI000E4B67C3|nr:MlaD family protein [Aeromicrobium sp. A1-2]AXT83930.1 MCE family protein [Aeromicrobium sp. A1-2]
MSNRHATRDAGIKLLLLAVLSIAVTITIAATIRPLGSGSPTRTYAAEFTSASRVRPGDDVRVAGVPVGRVSAVAVTSRATARVSLEVERDVALSTATRVEIRYLNLVGDRYVALVDPGTVDEPQRAAATIGVARTQPALDLNVLLNGFKPLFAALSPEDVNNLALDIVQTLQGDGSTVRDLITHTASLTTSLAERDDVITSVITNLNTTVGLVADRHTQLEQLIGGLDDFVSGLSRDRKVVGAAIEHVDSMTELSADLLADSRPALKTDIAHLRTIAETLNEPANRKLVEHTLDHVPDKLDRLTRTASYGSWFNYYVCGVSFKVSTKTGIDAGLARLFNDIRLTDTAERCQS